MSKNILIKIISVFFFLSAIITVRQIYISSNYETLNNSIAFLYSTLIFSISILFVLTLLKPAKIIYKTAKKEESKTEEETFETNKQDKTKQKINNLISEIKSLNPNDNIPEKTLKSFAKTFHIVQGIFYVKTENKFIKKAGYALYGNEEYSFVEGEGIPGQAAKNKKIKILKDIPDDYIQIVSGLGSGAPKNIVYIPFTSNNKTFALLEIALFDDFPEDFLNYANDISKILTEKLNLKNDK